MGTTHSALGANRDRGGTAVTLAHARAAFVAPEGTPDWRTKIGIEAPVFSKNRLFVGVGGKVEPVRANATAG